MRRKLFIGSLVFALVAIAGVAFAGWRGHRHFSPERMERFVGHHVDGVLDDIEATDAQRKVVNEQKDALFAEARELMARKGELHGVFLEAWKSDAPDAAKLHALVDERVDEWRALMHKAVDAGVAVHDVLEPSQRAAIAEDIGERHQCRHGKE